MELVHIILSRGYQLNSDVFFAISVLRSGDTVDKGEADVTMEIISLIDNMKIQKDNKHHGWRQLCRNKNQISVLLQ